MKTKEEIEKMSEENYPISIWGEEGSTVRRLAFENGYNKCHEDKNNVFYSEIEYLIIMWGNDGTKTAGYLTREILKLINK